MQETIKVENTMPTYLLFSNILFLEIFVCKDKPYSFVSFNSTNSENHELLSTFVSCIKMNFVGLSRGNTQIRNHFHINRQESLENTIELSQICWHETHENFQNDINREYITHF